MLYKDLVKGISIRLKEARKHAGYSGPQMANALNLDRSSYYRNELGKNAPGLISMVNIAYKLGVSLDWLVLDRGEMIYTDHSESDEHQSPEMNENVKEMVETMNKIPMLHHELLMVFHKFKAENAEIVAKAMMPKD